MAKKRTAEDEPVIRDEVVAQTHHVEPPAAPTPEVTAALGVLDEFESLLLAGTPVTPAYLRKATDILRAALAHHSA